MGQKYSRRRGKELGMSEDLKKARAVEGSKRESGRR